LVCFLYLYDVRLGTNLIMTEVLHNSPQTANIISSGCEEGDGRRIVVTMVKASCTPYGQSNSLQSCDVLWAAEGVVDIGLRTPTSSGMYCHYPLAPPLCFKWMDGLYKLIDVEDGPGT
jgi:hypothetical protein